MSILVHTLDVKPASFMMMLRDPGASLSIPHFPMSMHLLGSSSWRDEKTNEGQM